MASEHETEPEEKEERANMSQLASLNFKAHLIETQPVKSNPVYRHEPRIALQALTKERRVRSKNERKKQAGEKQSNNKSMPGTGDLGGGRGGNAALGCRSGGSCPMRWPQSCAWPSRRRRWRPRRRQGRLWLWGGGHRRPRRLQGCAWLFVVEMLVAAAAARPPALAVRVAAARCGGRPGAPCRWSRGGLRPRRRQGCAWLLAARILSVLGVGICHGCVSVCFRRRVRDRGTTIVILVAEAG